MLDGFTVGITADRRSDEQVALFERRGAAVVHGPSIRTLPLDDDERLHAITTELIGDPPQFVMANTGLGIRSWFGAAEAWGDGDGLHDALAQAVIFARGPKASGAIHSLGLEVEARAPSERLSECIDMALLRIRPGDRVVLQLDGGGTPAEADVLRAAGAKVIEVPIYRWQAAEDARPAHRLAEGVIGGRVHAVTFTAGPAITNWFALCADVGLAEPLRDRLASGTTVVGCVGPVCAEAAEAEGLGAGDVVMPRTSRLGPLVRSVADRLVAKARHVGELTITGTVVRRGGWRIELSDTEARILDTLADRPGAVVAKADLLRTVWGDADGDPHVVEVAVGRLRRRLGDEGKMIVAVPRRGYVLRP